jgi:serine/threonine-protein kinase RsbW
MSPSHLNGYGAAAPSDWRCLRIRTTDEMERVIADVLQEMRAAGYSERELFGMRLSLEEAIVNAIKHGHGSDPSKVVRVDYHIDEREIIAEVEDQGPGFRPEEVPDPLEPENMERSCGRGLLLMRSFMTSVRYNQRGNCVTLCKNRSA